MAKGSRPRPRSLSQQLLGTQNTILEQLRQDVAEWQRAGERSDRQHRATLQAMAAISTMLQRQAAALRDIHAITTRVLEQSNRILLEIGASGTTH
jgi:hypothetical protein